VVPNALEMYDPVLRADQYFLGENVWKRYQAMFDLVPQYKTIKPFSFLILMWEQEGTKR
jgi:hypothetical protein